MPKYWRKQMFTHGSFPEVGQKQKKERKKRKIFGDNNGQVTHGARIAHASRLGQNMLNSERDTFLRHPLSNACLKSI